jgi:hypothetical protein
VGNPEDLVDDEKPTVTIEYGGSCQVPSFYFKVVRRHCFLKVPGARCQVPGARCKVQGAIFYSKCQMPLVLFEVVSCHCFTLKVPGATVLFERCQVQLFCI